MNILAIDPGPVESAYVIWDGHQILAFNKCSNSVLLYQLYNQVTLSDYGPPADVCIIEQIKSYGMPVSDSIFDTVYWSGRFREAWADKGYFDRIPRREVKLHLCGSMRAKDGNIIQALKNRFESDLKPRQRPKGILKGMRSDIWQALALAVYWSDTNVR